MREACEQDDKTTKRQKLENEELSCTLTQRRTHTAALSAARLVHATAIDDHASQHARKLAALDTSHRNALKVAAADAAAATTAAVASEKLKHLQVQARRDAEHSASVEALHRAQALNNWADEEYAQGRNPLAALPQTSHEP